VQGWTDRLVSLAASPALRTQLSEAGLRLVRTKYDWELLGAKLRETYQRWASER
jgi:glycosyltransferase involved in cell wall biosynthesis